MFIERKSLAANIFPLWKDFLQLIHRDRVGQ